MQAMMNPEQIVEEIKETEIECFLVMVSTKDPESPFQIAYEKSDFIHLLKTNNWICYCDLQHEMAVYIEFTERIMLDAFGPVSKLRVFFPKSTYESIFYVT